MKTRTNLQTSFVYWQRVKGLPACVALQYARQDMADGKQRYTAREYAYNPAWEGTKTRWCESLKACGLRFVGYADELANIRHKGWYRDTFQSETLRGCVLQLPARNGREQFLPAYEDPNNPGTYAVDFDVIEGERGGYYDKDTQAKRDAARAADSFAEHEAEKEREYDEAWQAGSTYRAARDEIETEREELRALIRELKTARNHGPEICKALRATVKEKRRTMYRAWKRAEAAKEHIWREFYAAFNDGAGETVFKA